MKNITLEQYSKWRDRNPKLNFKYMGIRQNMANYLGLKKTLSLEQVVTLEGRYITKKLK